MYASYYTYNNLCTSTTFPLAFNVHKFIYIYIYRS